jgi:hypothetical protein
MIATSSPVTSAVLAALGDIGPPIGDAQAPPGGGQLYGIVRTSIVRSEGTLVDPHESGLHRVEFTAVGLDRAGVEWLLDEARDVLLGGLTLEDHAVAWSEPAGGQPPRPDYDVDPAPIFGVVVVNLFVSPI